MALACSVPTSSLSWAYSNAAVSSACRSKSGLIKRSKAFEISSTDKGFCTSISARFIKASTVMPLFRNKSVDCSRARFRISACNSSTFSMKLSAFCANWLSRFSAFQSSAVTGCCKSLPDLFAKRNTRTVMLPFKMLR